MPTYSVKPQFFNFATQVLKLTVASKASSYGC